MLVTQSFDVFFDLRPNKWLANNRDAGDLRRYRAHYDVIIMKLNQSRAISSEWLRSDPTNIWDLIIALVTTSPHMEHCVSIFLVIMMNPRFIPADTWRKISVIIKSKWHFDVVLMQ